MSDFERFMRKHSKEPEGAGSASDRSASDGPALEVEHDLPNGEEASASPSADSEIDRLAREKAELLDRIARMQAEFDNARKRASREQQEFKEYAVANAITPLLPILDSLDRAVHFEDASAADLHAGVELISKQLHDALNKLGLQVVHAKGELFDPHQHQAIEMVETNEVPDGYVFDELQPGYKLKDRLLRPAMVRVAKAASS
jgi:molecular chaperone GrpE